MRTREYEKLLIYKSFLFKKIFVHLWVKISEMDKKKNKGGRPTDFRDNFIEQAYNLALLGATDAQMAKIFDVSEQTFNAWKHKHPKFLEALKEGKEEADAKVVKSLYNRALGYSHADEKIFNDNGKALIVPTTKHYPPDVTAAIFWLKNRQSKIWRDRPQDDADDVRDISVNVNIIKPDED